MGGGVGGHTAASATARDERKGVAELSQGLASAAAAHCAASALHHGAQLFHHLLLHQWYDGWVTEPTRGFRNPRVGSVHAPRNPRTRTPWVRGSQSSEPTVFLEFHFPGLCWQTVLGFWCFRSFTGACLQTSSPSPSRPNVRTLPKSHPCAHRLRRANAKSDAMSDHGVGSPWRQSVQVCRWRRRSPGRPKKRRRRDAAARQVGRE